MVALEALETPFFKNLGTVSSHLLLQQNAWQSHFLAMIPAQIFPKFPLGQEKINFLLFLRPCKQKNKTFEETQRAILIESGFFVLNFRLKCFFLTCLGNHQKRHFK
jgi:hypothetical protein